MTHSCKLETKTLIESKILEFCESEFYNKDKEVIE